MNLNQAALTCFQKYATVAGRASRSEYWYWCLFIFLGRIVLIVLDHVLFHNVIGGHFWNPLSSVFVLATLVPSVAVGVRRLHDVDHTGWWLLIGFTIIGAFFPLLYWNCSKGTTGSNRFGDDPLTTS